MKPQSHYLARSGAPGVILMSFNEFSLAEVSAQPLRRGSGSARGASRIVLGWIRSTLGLGGGNPSLLSHPAFLGMQVGFGEVYSQQSVFLGFSSWEMSTEGVWP